MLQKLIPLEESKNYNTPHILTQTWSMTQCELGILVYTYICLIYSIPMLTA